MADFFPLPGLDDAVGLPSMYSLSPVNLAFFVPQLQDKPQNPIMDTLKRYRPPEEIIQEETIALPTLPPADVPRSIWLEALHRRTGLQSQVLSWDNLHFKQRQPATRTAFLSEQDSHVFSSARHHLQPRLHNPNIDIVHITPDVLWSNLRKTVCGTASQLHSWDPATERFVQIGLKDGREGRFLVDGKDEVISYSVLKPFMRIGNLLRRLETLLVTLRARNARDGPTIHAFAHALSTVLTYLRESLARSPLPTQAPKDLLSAKLTTHYDYYDEILVALSALCGVGDERSPMEYDIPESEPQPLLSRIYDHLHSHFERQSHKTILALLAYLLTSTSQEYFLQISHLVGFGGLPAIGPSTELLDGIKQENLLDNIDSTDEDVFPNFAPDALIEALPAARKSLILLRAAQADHPLLKMHTTGQDEIRWFWREEEILAEHPALPPKVAPDSVRVEDTEDPFAQFVIFDMEPGTQIGPSCFDQEHITSSIGNLETFIDTFPSKLPLITPTLSHLTSLVFKPLLQHASTLSSALLSLFISSSTRLNLQTHMKLLQSYLLLGSPEFKARLNRALFSDHEDTDFDEQTRNPMSIYALRHRSSHVQRAEDSVWAVGLAPTLLDRDTWPPVGADLSFFLRTVIVDTFRAAVGNKMESDAKQGALEDLDNRLGFAIRDLPVGKGKDRWLNPLSIEALDFLYMEYKPPHPLGVLITPEIMAKYQRMFSFLLRLTRVENALAAVFRMTRPSDAPLFDTFSSSRKLLFHLRFISQSLVSSLSQYTFVTAIGGNFDSFMSRLSLDAPALLWDGRPSGFSDVFELARAHSELLDDVLSACAMRSTQRAIGDMLRDVLEIVLEFCIFVGRLKRGQMEEYDAAPMLEELHSRLRRKMTSLTKMIRSVVEKHAGAAPMFIPRREGQPHIKRPPGGVQALSHLLLQWDASNWWASSIGKDR